MGSLWNRSGTFERVGDDVPAAGAKAYFFLGGTTTPMAVYQDAGENSAHTHPLTADAYGRWPSVFVPYVVSFDVLTTTAEGEQLTYVLEIPNPDPVDLSVTIGATEKVQTGMIHAELINTTRAGYVRLNGRTIGNAVSSATERANADTEDLFTYLWNAVDDTIAAVSGGRGASAAADYAANKTLSLPDCRATAFTGLDDMGNSAAGFFYVTDFWSGDETTAGSWIGNNGLAFTTGNLPPHTHTGTTASSGAHTHTFSGTTGNESATHTHTTAVSLSGTTGNETAAHTHNYLKPVFTTAAAPGSVTVATSSTSDATDQESANHAHSWSGSDSFVSGNASASHTHDFSGTTVSDGAHTHTFTTSSTGSGDIYNNIPLVRLVTWYIKL